MSIPTELRVAIDSFVDLREKFTLKEIRDVYNRLIEESGVFHDALSEKKFKSHVIDLFERGDVHGYAIIAQPYVDDAGPKFKLEFVPNNPMSIGTIDMLEIPDDYRKVTCKIHPYYKEFLKFLSDQTGTSQDMIARSVLSKSLALIIDQLK